MSYLRTRLRSLLAIGRLAPEFRAFADAQLVLVVSPTVTAPAVHAARVLPSSALRYQ